MIRLEELGELRDTSPVSVDDSPVLVAVVELEDGLEFVELLLRGLSLLEHVRSVASRLAGGAPQRV